MSVHSGFFTSLLVTPIGGTMDWIDDTVAVGDWFDGFSAQRRRHEGIDLIIDSRVLFTKSVFSFKRTPLVEMMLRTRDQIVGVVPFHPKILIFCNRGRDRSTFVAMLYVKKRYSLGYQEAYEMVRSKRKQTTYHWDWVKAFDLVAPESTPSL
jgi:hypothetical protein